MQNSTSYRLAALPTLNWSGGRASRTVLALILPVLAWLVFPAQARAEYQSCVSITLSGSAYASDESNDWSITDPDGATTSGRVVKGLAKAPGGCTRHFPWWLQAKKHTHTVSISGPGRSCSITFETQYQGRVFDYELKCTVASNNGCGFEVNWPSVSSAYVSIAQCIYSAWLP